MHDPNRLTWGIGYWPILIGALAALSVPFLFTPPPSVDSPALGERGAVTASRESKAKPSDAVESPRTGRLDSARANRPEVDDGERLQADSFVGEPSLEGETTVDESFEPPVGPLRSRIADWRYLGGAVSSGKSVARIQRMEAPDRIHHVREGGRLEGVAVCEISSASIRATLNDESQILFLDSGPAFDPGEVLLPKEVLDDPEVLASVVFAQTIGRYVAEQPDFSSGEVSSEPDRDTLHEAMDSLSREISLVPPQPGESPEAWTEAAAKGLAADPHSTLDPTRHPLSEEARLTLLGVHLLPTD